MRQQRWKAGPAKKPGEFQKQKAAHVRFQQTYDALRGLRDSREVAEVEVKAWSPSGKLGSYIVGNTDHRVYGARAAFGDAILVLFGKVRGKRARFRVMFARDGGLVLDGSRRGYVGRRQVFGTVLNADAFGEPLSVTRPT